MKILELPESGRFINADLITIVEHEVIEGVSTAVTYFASDDRLLLTGQDAEFLVAVIRDCV